MRRSARPNYTSASSTTSRNLICLSLQILNICSPITTTKTLLPRLSLFQQTILTLTTKQLFHQVHSSTLSLAFWTRISSNLDTPYSYTIPSTHNFSLSLITMKATAFFGLLVVVISTATLGKFRQITSLCYGCLLTGDSSDRQCPRQ